MNKEQREEGRGKRTDENEPTPRDSARRKRTFDSGVNLNRCKLSKYVDNGSYV